MPTKAELLFDSLHNPSAVLELIGKAEDTDLDCKQWRGDEQGKRLMLAKVVCGFANGDGGVVLLGMRADGRGDEPDLIKETAFFLSPEEVKAKALSIIQSDIEPLVQGVRASAVVMDEAGNGVVVILVPSSDGLPHRSKQDWKFHLRSGSSTQNMPLTVLADRFGRRPHAELRATVEKVSIEGLPTFSENVEWGRVLDIYVENIGRGLARFPSLLLSKACSFIPLIHLYGPQDYLWPLTQAEEKWRSFRGGVEAVVYPGEKLLVCRVVQSSSEPEPAVLPEGELHAGTLCEGAPNSEFPIP